MMEVDKILKESLEINKKYREFKKNKRVSLKNFKESLKVEFPFLSENYSTIFEISVGESYNYIRLQKMLILANQVQNDEITEHSASVEVGQILVDDIVKPSLKK